ncbi:acetylxylan esterase [Amycolatopsis sp. NPDC088138]|uniref:poly(ethylene terephthalate) hydrolase family protein n=1 Tax=Amycolatopsis sp. NPDC088138 TaxID=3363938 RepID=UPI0037F19D8D
MRRLWLVVVVTVLLALPRPAEAAAVDWQQPGPFAVVSEALDGSHTVFRPADLGGAAHPVILWGNGTGQVPADYAPLLRHLASYGFVVAAADTVNSGTGREMLDGARTLVAENARPGSAYFGRIDTAHIGATGHSQGGGGAIAAGADPLVTTTVPIAPGPLGWVPSLHGPVLFLGGQFDLVVAPLLLVIPRYYAAWRVPAVYGELAGATHTTGTGDAGGFRGAITAWFRYWLSGDQRAKDAIFGSPSTLSTGATWSKVLRNDLAREV